ncbi:hypothetical protein AB1Y20_007152 [Prymnesium parvum]|uniref:Uncharacterized protein n=1 Tax=Prymnesium parvum TaxID=97485 RepID=A0AB34IWU6_PRYPA|mmetsp:Transcript_15759/g.39491  ORF Transcript_15759/g.39491 Transcript_15759/m.39491 type:complete len:146 (+) Transcript_15759:83-520(+)
MLLQTTRYLNVLELNRPFFSDLRADQTHVQQLPWCAASRAPALDEASAPGCVYEPFTSCAAEESTVLSCAETNPKWSALSRQANSVRIGKFGRAASSKEMTCYGPHTPALRPFHAMEVFGSTHNCCNSSFDYALKSTHALLLTAR